MKQNIFVFDVESTSLHGTGFAVGAVVINLLNFKEVDRFVLKSIEGSEKASDWVKQNVLPFLTDIPSVNTDRELRDQFWKFYTNHKETSTIWADVAYPVETNFLEQVYSDDPNAREFEMPYPLMDVSSQVNVDLDRVILCEKEG